MTLGSEPLTLSFRGSDLRELPRMTNLCTEILDFRGFDPSRILLLRGGIPMPTGNLPESLSQRLLAGIILVERLGGYHGRPSRIYTYT